MVQKGDRHCCRNGPKGASHNGACPLSEPCQSTQIELYYNTRMLWTIEAAAEEIRQGRLTPVDLLDSCLKQIDRYEERVRAWVLIDREGARQQAEWAAAEIKRGHYRGPLHGIPVGIKDIIDVFDWPTAAGSKLWANAIARRDAPVVARLRQAGAIILGKTVTTQYASFDPSPTRNPWNLERTPGGSSSGSAAAVACGMCVAALASQTGGSITRPASYCGVASCKPTYDLVSTKGVVPLAHSMDHIGAIAGSVHGLAAVLQTIAEPLAKDLVDRLEKRPGPPRLGRLRGMFEQMAEPEMTALMNRVSREFESNGATVTDIALPPGFADVVACHRTVMAVEAAAFHGARLRRHPEDYSPCIRGLLEEGLACSATEYARCRDHQRELRDEMELPFSDLHVLLMPATIGPAPAAATTGDPAFNSPWSYTGQPTVSLPAGRSSDGMPLAIQLAANPNFESLLFAVAAWCERVLAWERREPARAIV
jgi:Asp-tRNA(Asn)/Glu-tRNA(Gln) amidotransferase A subunit family amidase